MQFAASIQEAASRIDEAAAIYRFKARHAATEFDDAGGRWGDSRSRHFEQHHLQSTRETMEQGEGLCRQHSELVATAKSSAWEAESELSAFFSVQSEYEVTTTHTEEAIDEAAKLTARVNTDTGPLSDELESLGASISEAAQDSGWKPRPLYQGPARQDAE
jgi:hypothetical protein